MFVGAAPHMTAAAIGSLFTGAGALCDMAVAPLLGGRVVWHCENDPAAGRVLAHRRPGTPNLGDITAVDWSTVPPVRVLTGGFPCTDVSSAGKRAGLRPDTRSGLWSHMAYAIGQLRPELVVVENVRGLASAPAHSDVEPCPWCLGDGPEVVAVRALGAVLGDLADLRYDAVWCGLRASDIGAPHPRFRFVILAVPADPAGAGRGSLKQVDVSWHGGETNGRRPAESGRRSGAVADSDRARRLGPWLSGSDLRIADRSAARRDDREPLLPTPRATDGTKGGPNQRGSSGDLMLPSAVMSLLPTPTATNGGNWSLQDRSTTLAAELAVDWGKYAPAIDRWAWLLGRPAPHPTVTGPKGGKTLNPALSEWMMGWPAGWVTEVPGITVNDQKRLCGNGVVPQQIQAAMRFLAPILITDQLGAASCQGDPAERGDRNG
ncbi:MAG: DNA cytosine methyltransferase [Labedaea sp.]